MLADAHLGAQDLPKGREEQRFPLCRLLWAVTGASLRDHWPGGMMVMMVVVMIVVMAATLSMAVFMVTFTCKGVANSLSAGILAGHSPLVWLLLNLPRCFCNRQGASADKLHVKAATIPTP